ncbi:MAG: MFS transporter, partial [Phycisphaeraceae bacterium]
NATPLAGASRLQSAPMLRAYLQSLSPRRLPLMTRPSYRQEMFTAATYPAVLAMIEGGVVGIIAVKVFNVSAMVFAAIVASSNFANLTSFLWARLARGRRKVASIVSMMLGLLLCVTLISFLPRTDAGGGQLALLVIIARCLQTGIITLRSTVWRMNYPAHLRAQITGRIALFNAVLLAVIPMAAGALLDHNADTFRYIYPATVLLALVGVIAYSRIRLRGERELLKYEKQPDARPLPHGAPDPLYEYDPKASRPTFWSVLKQDKLFRQYMLWQFVNGTAAMMGDAVLVYLIARLTQGMHDEFLISNSLTTALPVIMVVITLPLWARLLDRLHIIQFRARHGSLWVLVQLITWLGAMFASLWILAISRLIVGIARGGGMLAWNLGHNDFADRRMVALYMGIHVTLTGIRGAIAPFVAIILFTGKIDLFAGVKLELPWLHIEHHLFLVTAALSLWAEIGFIRLGRSMGVSGKKQ